MEKEKSSGMTERIREDSKHLQHLRDNMRSRYSAAGIDVRVRRLFVNTLHLITRVSSFSELNVYENAGSVSSDDTLYEIVRLSVSRNGKVPNVVLGLYELTGDVDIVTITAMSPEDREFYLRPIVIVTE